MTDVTNSPNFYIGRSADVGDLLDFRDLLDVCQTGGGKRSV